MENRCRSAMDLRNRKSSLGGAVTSPTPPVYIIGASSLYASPQQLIHQSVRLKSNSASRLRSNAPANAQPEVRRTLPMSRSYDHRDVLGKRQNQSKLFHSRRPSVDFRWFLGQSSAQGLWELLSTILALILSPVIASHMRRTRSLPSHALSCRLFAVLQY